jgi:hypothetical protein
MYILPILPDLITEITTKDEDYYASTTQFSIYSCHYLISLYLRTTGHAVARLVETLRYMPEGRGFDFRWCHWNFSLT